MFDEKCSQFWLESDYLTFEVILEYWCGNNRRCREAKKFTIIAACDRGDIEYDRSDGKTFNDAVKQLIGQKILLIHRESFEKWIEKFNDKDKPNFPLDSRSEKTYFNIIGALLDIIKGKHGEIKFKPEAELRAFLDEKYDGFQGLSERTLADKFAKAKKVLYSEYTNDENNNYIIIY